MTLLGGVGGAFTGASVANQRKAEQAELARQIARQAGLDERQMTLDRESAFDRRIQREANLGELGYQRGEIPRTGSAMMQMPGMGALDVGSVMDARIGPSLTTPDGGKFTLDRTQTPQAQAQSAATMKREDARREIEARLAERNSDRSFQLYRDEQNNAARIQAAAASAARTTGAAEARAQATAQTKRQEMFRAAGEDIDAIDAALAEVGSNASAFGLKNYLPGVLRRRIPGRDNAADAQSIGSVEYVVGRLRHDRFGGALTPTEVAKAGRIFSDPTSPPEQIAKELGILRDRLAKRQRTLNPMRSGPTPASPVAEEGKPYNPDEWDQ